jgi:uncharacterized protein (TIGR02444 family)
MRAWDFVVERHAEPGVEAACLALQDRHGQCVSLLLWRAWAEAEAIAAPPPLIEAAVQAARAWDAEVVRPLRAIRRRLKAPLPAIADASREGLRQGVLAQELSAERALIEALEGLACAWPAPSAAAAGAADGALGALRVTAIAWGRGAPDDLLAKVAGG